MEWAKKVRPNTYFELWVRGADGLRRLHASSDKVEKPMARTCLDRFSSPDIFKEAVAGKASVLLFEDPVADPGKQIEALPYQALFIGAILVGLQKGTMSDQTQRFMSRLTQTKFTQAYFDLCKDPVRGLENRSLYKDFLIRRIVRIAVDKFVRFAEMAMKAIGAAA